MATSAGTAELVGCMIIHSDFQAATMSNGINPNLSGATTEQAVKAIPYFYVFALYRTGFARNGFVQVMRR
jgi:hypothetical protein